MRVARLALVAVLALGALAACGDDGGGSGSGSGDAGGQDFCSVAEEIYSGTGPQPEGGADAEDIVDIFRRLEEAAPPEIATDAEIVRQSIEVLLGVEERTDDTPSQERLGIAEDNMRTYLLDECGIVPPENSTPPTTSAAA